MDKKSQSMPTAPSAPGAPSAPSVQLTGTKASETAKKVNDLSIQLKDQVTQLEAAKKAMQEAAKKATQEAAQKAKQTQLATQTADDQSADDIMKTIKKTIEKLWELVADKQGKTEKDAVASVRGTISWRDEQIKIAKKKVTDKIPGGEATGVDVEELNKKQLDMGEKVEMEHTDSPEAAREIASDHLAEELKGGKEKEDQEYYTELKKVHEDKCNASVPAFWRRNLDYGNH